MYLQEYKGEYFRNVPLWPSFDFFILFFSKIFKPPVAKKHVIHYITSSLTWLMGWFRRHEMKFPSFGQRNNQQLLNHFWLLMIINYYLNLFHHYFNFISLLFHCYFTIIYLFIIWVLLSFYYLYYLYCLYFYIFCVAFKHFDYIDPLPFNSI